MIRIDKALMERGLCRSRSQAQALVKSGQVEVREGTGWTKAGKASQLVSPEDAIRVLDNAISRYVSRAGLKLESALRDTRLPVQGLCLLDVGQSTGGFTDCLLQAGCARVVGIEVGHDQLDSRLREDSRVVCLEGVNARQLPETVRTHADDEDGFFDGAVMDVSFISQTLIWPSLAPLIHENGWIITLVKPQFEAGPEWIGKKGIVRDPACYQMVREKVTETAESCGYSCFYWADSPITGGDGNREFLAAFRHPAQ